MAKRKSLSNTHPHLVSEWDFDKNGSLHPDDCPTGTHKKVWWLCKHGHSWDAQISNRTYGGQGCPYCAGRRVLRGLNDLATVVPELVAEWDYDKNNGLMPWEISSASHKAVWWKCKNGHSWQSAVNNRKRGNGCPYCSGRKPLKGVNDLVTLYPEIAAEWNYDKNGTLSPSDVTARSNKNVWWIGACGHNWRTNINNRTRGHGCPYCSGRYAIPGVNDLKTVSPELAAEWDYNKNAGIMPYEFLMFSGRKVWWLCKQGHSWQATISRRTQGCNCPYCTGRLVLHGVNDLATLHPELALEWDYDKNGTLKPHDVKAGSSQRARWLCKHGHSWNTLIYSRSIGGTGCPYCSSVAILPGFNDFATLSPKAASEWDTDKNFPLTPSTIGTDSGKNVWWRCGFGHSWQAQVATRKRGGGCPVCAGKIVLQGFNDFASLFPELLAEWDYTKNGALSPHVLSPNTSKKVWWICEKSHRWTASIGKRTRGSKCPYCFGYSVLPGYNDLSTINPTLAAEWNPDKNEGFTPDMFTVSSGKAVWWRCSFGHSWCATIANRNKGNGCPVCAGFKISKGFNDLLTVLPEIASEWDYNKNDGAHPEDFYYGSTKKAWWRCAKGHSWYSQIRLRQKCGCPYCAGNLADPGVNDLLTLFPDVAAQWDYSRNETLSPQDFTAKSGKKVWWICDLGHSWKSTIASRTGLGHGCPYCAGQRIASGINDLKTLFPELMLEWDYEKNDNLNPDELASSSRRKVWWTCKRGHSWIAAITDRTGGNGCPFCVGKRYRRPRLVR